MPGDLGGAIKLWNIMNNQFLFFCCNIGNEDLLKEEIRVFFPELTLSYSRKGFLTFKNKGVQYNQNSIGQLAATFSTRSGICLGKSRPEDLVHTLSELCSNNEIDFGKCIVHNFSVNTEYTFDASVLHREINEYSPINKTVINLISLGNKEVWIGLHKVARYTSSYPNGIKEIPVPENAPSRAYLKLAEIVETFNVAFDRFDSWLDFGCVPGGATTYLLDKGCKVWGIDPAKMPKEVLEHPRYTHIASSVQDLSQEELPAREINWVHVDININPKQSIKEVLRLCKKYDGRLKGIIFSIQIIKMDHVKNIENFEDHFYDWGFTNVTNCQVPTHKKEYVLIAKR